MRREFVILFLTSVLILGTLGSQDVFAGFSSPPNGDVIEFEPRFGGSGPVFLTGFDPGFHIVFTPSADEFYQVITNMMPQISNGGTGVLVLEDDSCSDYWQRSAVVTGVPVLNVPRTAIPTVSFDEAAIIVIPDGCIGKDNAYYDLLVGRGSDIFDFVQNGGGLIAMTDFNNFSPRDYDYLSGFGTFDTNVRFEDNITIIKPGGLMTGLTDAGLSGWGVSVHTSIDIFPLGFEVLATGSSGRPVIIGFEADVVCQPGEFDNGDACVPCSAGSFSDTAGATECRLADPGSSVSTTGSAVQHQCLVGTFSSGFGNTSCLICTPGSYQPSTGQELCLLADPGNFVEGGGATAQEQCQEGTFSSEVGSASCSSCPEGEIPNETQTACVVPSADLRVESTFAVTVVNPGETFVYTVTVTNDGPDTAEGFTLQDFLRPRAPITFVDVTPIPECALRSSLAASCSFGPLAPGDSQVILLTVQVSSTPRDGTIIPNTVRVIPITADPDTTNNAFTSRGPTVDVP